MDPLEGNTLPRQMCPITLCNQLFLELEGISCDNKRQKDCKPAALHSYPETTNKLSLSISAIWKVPSGSLAAKPCYFSGF